MDDIIKLASASHASAHLIFWGSIGLIKLSTKLFTKKDKSSSTTTTTLISSSTPSPTYDEDVLLSNAPNESPIPQLRTNLMKNKQPQPQTQTQHQSQPQSQPPIIPKIAPATTAAINRRISRLSEVSNRSFTTNQSNQSFISSSSSSLYQDLPISSRLIMWIEDEDDLDKGLTLFFKLSSRSPLSALIIGIASFLDSNQPIPISLFYVAEPEYEVVRSLSLLSSPKASLIEPDYQSGTFTILPILADCIVRVLNQTVVQHDSSNDCIPCDQCGLHSIQVGPVFEPIDFVADSQYPAHFSMCELCHSSGFRKKFTYTPKRHSSSFLDRGLTLAQTIWTWEEGEAYLNNPNSNKSLVSSSSPSLSMAGSPVSPSTSLINSPLSSASTVIYSSSASTSSAISPVSVTSPPIPPTSTSISRDRLDTLEQLLPHIISISNASIRSSTSISTALSLLSSTADFILSHGPSIQASIDLRQETITLCEDTFGSNHIFTAFSHSRLGRALYQIEDYAAAFTSLQKAYSILSSQISSFLSLEPESFYDCLTGLAAVYEILGHSTEAETMHKRLLDIFEADTEYTKLYLLALAEISDFYRFSTTLPSSLALPYLQKGISLWTQQLESLSTLDLSHIYDSLAVCHSNYAEILAEEQIEENQSKANEDDDEDAEKIKKSKKATQLSHLLSALKYKLLASTEEGERSEGDNEEGSSNNASNNNANIANNNNNNSTRYDIAILQLRIADLKMEVEADYENCIQLYSSSYSTFLEILGPDSPETKNILYLLERAQEFASAFSSSTSTNNKLIVSGN